MFVYLYAYFMRDYVIYLVKRICTLFESWPPNIQSVLYSCVCAHMNAFPHFTEFMNNKSIIFSKLLNIHRVNHRRTDAKNESLKFCWYNSFFSSRNFLEYTWCVHSTVHTQTQDLHCSLALWK